MEMADFVLEKQIIVAFSSLLPVRMLVIIHENSSSFPLPVNGL